MADFIGAYPESGEGGRSAHGETIRAEASGTCPVRPLGGSPLAALVGRQSGGPGADRRLGFVPVQVR